MHSRNSLKPRIRMTPYLITVGAGLSMATGALASPEMEKTTQQEPEDSEVPAPTIDTDGDGTADAWDRSGDGKPDAWDTDGDGEPDLLDDDGDGKPD